MVHPTGTSAVTTFRLRQRYDSGACRYALVEAELLTGRMHQIRVHLAHAGYPVVGDKIYGPDEQCYLEFIETGWTPALAARLELPRHALHAEELAFASTNQHWRAPLPPDLAAFLQPLTRVPTPSGHA